MRVKISKNNLDVLFAAVRRRASDEELSKKCEVSTRTIRSWRAGASSFSKEIFDQLVALSGLEPKVLTPVYVSDFDHASRAGRKGGLARLALYGPPGTPEGRRRGGLRSAEAHRRYNTGFTVRKTIRTPEKSEELAELLGILMGDGHLDKYQIEFVTNSVTDREHAFYVADLLGRLFGVKTRIWDRKDQRAISVVASSVALNEFVAQLGMPCGNKIAGGLSVPSWILERKSFSKAFVRGVFDTDGCIFLDKHFIRQKWYYNMGWTITSNADTFISGLLELLKNLGFSPTNRVTQNAIFMRRKHDIERYFSEIGTSNPKHLKRYTEFSGRVPKRSQRLRLEIG